MCGVMNTCRQILSGCTARRLIALAPSLTQGEHPVLKAVRVTRIPVAEARVAVEMMVIGSGILVHPVIEWDGKQVGDGE